jgi:two-component system response regulator YesN
MIRNVIKSKKFFIIVLTYITIFTVLILSLISVLFSANYSNFVLPILYSYSKSNLAQTSYISDSMLDSISTIFNQVTLNSSASLLMYSANEGDVNTLDALNWLSSYVETSSNIESIYIYNGQQGKISYGIKNIGSGTVSQNDFFDKSFITDISSGKFKESSPFVRITGKSELFQSASEKEVYTFVFNEYKSNSTSPNGAIIINFSEGTFQNILCYLNKSKNEAAFILNNEGVVISNNSSFPFMGNISGMEFVKQIKSSNAKSGYFISNINNTKSFVTFVKSNITNWEFVSIAPYSSIVSSLNRTVLINIFIYIIILIIGILAAVFISKKINKPYNIISDRIRNLEKQSNISSNYLKQEFLRNLLKNSDSFSYKELLEKLVQLNIKLNKDKPLTIIMFKIDNYRYFCDKHNFNDRNLYKFAIANIASEICLKHCTNETIINDDNIVILASTNETAELYKIVEEICVLVLKHLEISCSAVISSYINSLENINDIFDEVSEAFYYRIFTGYKSIVFADDVLKQKKSNYIYPELKVRNLMNLIMLGKLADAKQIYTEIIEDLKSYTYNTFIQTIMRLALEFSNTVCTLKKYNNISHIFNLNSFISDFLYFETIEDINSVFFTAFNQIASNNDEKKNRKFDNIIENVKLKIHEEYGDQNLSLNKLADEMKISPSYLRHLFKSASNQSLSDYISIVRIEKAKELLRTTTFSISKISDMIGFINTSYFFTVFRKINGVTPNEFRKNENSEL